MTVAEMNISNKERLSKLEALDPKTLNDILDNVFSKYFPMSKKEEKNTICLEEECCVKEEYPPYFGIWKDNGDEIKELIYKSRTKNKDYNL